MAGKRNIDRLRKSMRKDNAADAIKNAGQAAGRAGKSVAVTNVAKQGASAVRQAAQDAGQKYTGTNRSRGQDASNHKDRVGNPRLDALSEKYEETKKDKGFLPAMEKYMDKDARLKNAGAGGSGKDKPVSLEELKRDSIKIQEQAAKTQKSKDLDLEDDRFWNLTKGNIRQIVGSHVKTIGTTVEGSETNIVPASAGSTASFLMPPEYREQVEKSRMNAQKEGGRAMSEFGSSQIDKGAKEIEKGKEGLNGAEAFLADLYGAGLGLSADALFGPLSGAAMFSRSYGSAYDRAEKEGASPLQAMLYGASIGGVEAATEKMFGVAKPLRKLYGKGAGDDIIDTLLHKVSGKIASQKGKDLAWHGGKTAFSALTEGLEEMVSEGLEPSIANQIYAEAAGVPHETSAGDIFYAGLLGSAMGGSLGGVGQAVEYAQGRQVQDVFGEVGTKELAKKAAAADEDSGAGFAAAAMEKLIDNGQGIAAGQARELYQTVYKQEARDLERENTARQSSESIIRRENLVSPTVTDRETGRETLNVNTARLFDEKMAQAAEAAGAMQLPEAKAGQIAQSVARVETGVAGVDDVNLFTMPNREAREVYTAVTGKTLPETNKGTREALYETIAINRVNSARAETENHVDRVRGMIEQNMAQDYEAAGQEAFAQAFGEVDVRDVPQVEDAAVAFDDFYRAGRNGIAYADVVSAANPAYQNVAQPVKKAAWDAGQQDAFIASDTAKGLQMKIGQRAKENRAQKGTRGARGRVIAELSPEGKALLKASEQRVFRALARAFNIDIHIVEDERVNGFYQDGEVWLSVNADRGLPYVFAHEITHHMEAYAPEEYHRLKELVQARWAKEGGMDEAINEKRSQYAENGVELSYEDALDEIIADSTYEMVQDEAFVNELCRSHRRIAQSILDAIKAVLKKLRVVLAEGEGFTPKQNAALLSNLDILKDAERLWADGLMKAAENRDAVGNVQIESVVKYAKKDEMGSIRDQLRDNLDKLNEMKPVADVTYKSIKNLNRSEKAKAIMSDYNKKFKGGIERKNFGFIILTEKEVVGSLKYLYHDGEFAAFKALPQVLKRGKIIDEHINHKNRGIDTVTIAAPVLINDTPGIMAAAVKVGGKNRYHVHRILMPDGSEFEFKEKTEPTGAGMTTKNGRQGSAISSAFDSSIPDPDGNNNRKFSFKDSEGRELSQEQAEYFKDSKVRDEDGNLLAVYHGSSEDFTVFDREKTRANMDIQGNFFSPWELDASGYGENVRAFYLNITNPAPEGVAYKALNKFQGQNGAGIKAREYLESLGYDGVNNEGEEYIAFYPEQVKEVSNASPTSSPDIRYSFKDNTDITYDSLIAKPDMKIAAVTTTEDAVKDLSRKEIVSQAKGRLEIKALTDAQGRACIFNDDTKKDIIVGKPGIQHGLDRNYEHTAAVAMHLDEYLKSAIKINEAVADDGRKFDSDILLGYGENKKGEKIPAYFVVAQLKTGQDELVEFGSLYSMRAKKIVEDSAQGSRGVQSSTSTTISISDLLGVVNEMYSDILPKSVAGHYGHGRKESKLGKSVRFSLPDPDSVNDYINSHGTEFVEVPPVRDYEREGAAVRAQSIEELQEKVKKLQQDKHLTRGRVLDKTSVEEELNSLVRTLMGHSEGTSKKTDHRLVKMLSENASSIYTAVKGGDIAGAANTAWHAAQDAVENLRLVDDWAFHEYKELRDVMRTTAVTVSETDRGDIPDFADFRRRNMGRLRIVNQGGIAVDTLYAELCETYPELFPGDVTHPADQLMAMAGVREQLGPYDAMLSAEEAVQLAKETAQDLLDIAVRGKPWKSWADRKKECYDGKLKAMKARHKEALRDVKNRERMRAARMVDRERLKHREYKRKQKDRKEHVRRFGSIQKNYGWLSDRLLNPTDDKHIPEGFRAAVARLLQQIDLQTERSKSLEKKYGKAQKTLRMDELRRRFAEIAKEDGSGIFEYDGYIFELMDALAEKLEGKTIDQATNEELASIDTLLKAVASNVRNYDRAFTEGIKESISGLAGWAVDAAREHIEKHGNYSGRSGALGWMDTFLNESMVTPRDFFEQLGGGMQEVFLAMRKGMDRHVDNLTKTRDFFDEIFTPYRNRTALRKRAKPGSKIEKWRDGSELHKIGLESGQEISLSPAQVMSFYCLSKREQAQGHILGSGVVASRVDNASKLKQSLGAKVQTAGSAVMVSPADAEKIIALLTPEQREMADRLQGYLDGECAKWGNEVSMRLYGYRKFTEKDYFPIKSADQYLDSSFEGRQAAERIKNFGFTKGTVVNANNPVVIDDIFRVVSDHINKMSLYNAFAAPISDFTRVYNHKVRDEGGLLAGSVKSSLEDAYGRNAINYINNFMADVNGIAQTRTEGLMRFVNRSLANYKKATIGGNMRVALQQPTAVMRAFMLISPRYFVNGKINALKNLRDMKAHCQIARWKSWGHNQVDMARDIDDIMMNNEWTRLDVLTMELYGKLDDITWSTIWAAVRTETEAKHPDVAVDSEEFYAICNERASEIFDKTQVVDSVFHRSQAMRNTDTMSKMMTSFMAEPTRTFNMVRTELASAREMWKSGEKGAAAQKASRAATVFTMNAALCAAAAAIADALRGRDADDDGEEDGWLENFLENFKDNVNPLNMLPVVKDIWGFTDGWDSQNMALEGYASLVQSAIGLARADDPAEAFRKLAESMGLVFGIPVKNVLRDTEAIFNLFGINVFAAEAGVDGMVSKVKGTLMDKWAGLFGREDSSGDGEAGGAGRDKSDPGYYGIYADSKESLWDKITDKSYAERQKADREKRVSDIEKDVEGLSGDERDDAIWKAATKNYTRYVNDGEMDVLQEMRWTLGELGGDVEKFDESVLGKVKTAYKKNIGGDLGMLVTYDEYLMGQGFTEEKISSEIIAKSETAKEFQKQVCLNDYDAAVDALADLISAGITENDIYALYYNRAKSIDASDYSGGVFIAPVSGRISSGYGYRDAPTAGASSFHQAIDIAAPAGSDVVAADGGKVTRADWGNGYGWTVEILHGNGRYTKYSHLQGYTVQKGDVVSQGQLIGYVGSTGVSTGPHLDFKVKEGGQWVNPMNYLQ